MNTLALSLNSFPENSRNRTLLLNDRGNVTVTFEAMSDLIKAHSISTYTEGDVVVELTPGELATMFGPIEIFSVVV